MNILFLTCVPYISSQPFSNNPILTPGNDRMTLSSITSIPPDKDKVAAAALTPSFSWRITRRNHYKTGLKIC
jgi:hypothetical protein